VLQAKSDKQIAARRPPHSSLAAAPVCRMYEGRDQNQQSRRRWTGGSAFFPTNADFREGIVGAVELATGGETPTLRPSCVVVGGEGSGPTIRA
jgi:hypothetical protein